MVVVKFGGTSVANISRLTCVAHIVKRYIDKGITPVVVLSAMAGATNNLQNLASHISPASKSSFTDLVLSSGEQITVGLLAMALKNLGLNAQTFLGWQVPIITNDNHTDASIIAIDPTRLRQCAERGVIAIVAGFQGVTKSQDITTLGRGGSDLTAVHLTHALGIKECDIYSDVEGVFAADPRIVTGAQKIHHITYAEMLEMSQNGSKVLMDKAAELACAFNIELKLLSTFIESGATHVIADVPEQSRLVAICSKGHDISLIGKNIAQNAQRYIDKMPLEGRPSIHQHRITFDLKQPFKNVGLRQVYSTFISS